MTSFWIIAGIFIVTALLFVLPTLLRSKGAQERSGVEIDEANIGIYRDQLAELENDFRNDILSQSQYEKSKQELQQRLLQDVPKKNSLSNIAIKKGRNIATSFILTLAIPLSAIFLYLSIGDTRGLLPQAQLASVTQMQSGNDGVEGHPEFTSVLENLIARLNDNPEDIEGWVMLGRTYTIMGRFDEATKTYAKLVELVPDNPQILSDYADVLAMSNEGVLAGEPAALIQQALKIDPEYPKALALAGTVEFEQNRYGEAANYWERLLAVIPSDSKLAESVKDSIAEAKSLASIGQVAPAAEQTTAVTTDNQENNTVVAKNDSDSADATESSAAAGDASISGTVTIDSSLASKAAPNDTLFIYARAKTGPRMPLAILRLKASDLPATFSLNDDMAMTPAMKISSFPEVVVEARISKSGQAVPTSGDLQGFSQPVKLGDKNVSIEIDQQVP